ncbi:hypothetical protein NE865_14341 [Phthorimaea operculella]|nr:hypothetical protein NE865_14341 [Phthorimaea operculella]
MQLLQYMSARRLQHSAWRVIPLDMQLPLAVLSTCVTYLIVIIHSHTCIDATAAVHVRASLAALGVARDPAGHAAAARRAQHLRHLPHRHHTVHTLVLMQLLQYMSARRLQHSAWRVIPLDMQLPLAVLSTCVTYLIVIIQFTHLY